MPSHRSARDRCPLASPRISLLLALEEPGPGWSRIDRSRDPWLGPARVSGQSAVGYAAEPWRAVEARDQGCEATYRAISIPSRHSPSLALSSTDILYDTPLEAYHQVLLVRLQNFLKSMTYICCPRFVRFRRLAPKNRCKHQRRLLADTGVGVTRAIADLAV